MKEIICSTGERRKSYKAYLKTDHWLNKRIRLIAIANRTCSDCGKQYKKNQCLALHHLTYARIGNELDEDIVVICHKCHGLRHPDKKVKKVKKKTTRAKPKAKKKPKKYIKKPSEFSQSQKVKRVANRRPPSPGMLKNDKGGKISKQQLELRARFNKIMEVEL